MSGIETVGQLNAVFDIDLSPLDRGLRKASSMLTTFERRHGDATDVDLELTGLSAFQSGVQAASRMISNLDGQKATATINERGAVPTSQKVQAVTRFVENLNGKSATANINERGAAPTSQRVQTVIRFVENLNGKNATARIGERGAAPTAASVSNVHGIVNRMNGQSAIVRIAERGAAAVTAAIGAVYAAAGRLDGRNVVVRVSERGTAGVIAAFAGLGAAMGGVGAAAAAMDNGLSMGRVRILAIGGAAVTAAALFTPLLGGLAALGTMAASAAGGFGLILAAAIPTIRALGEHETATNKVESAQDSATSAARTLADAQSGLEKASSGVADAQASAAKAVAKAESAYRDALEAVEDAERSLVKATQGVADARREANEGVQNAVKRYEDALRGVEDAERNLAKATEGVADARREANEGVQDAVRRYEDSLEAVEDAERNLAKAVQGVRDARREANEGVQDAVQRYRDSLEAVKDAEEDVREAAQGVRDARREANEGVVDAQERYRDSLRSVEDAERRLKDSRQSLNDATRDLRMAQEDLNAAMRAEPRNQAYAELDLADARDRLSDATRDYNEAVAKYGENSEEATDALRRMQRAELDLQAQQEETAEVRRKGSDELRSAQAAAEAASEREAKARQAVLDSERALADARKDAAEAYRGIAEAQIEGARRVAAAQKQVADAQERLTDAVQAAAEAQAGIEEARIEGARRVADAQEQVAEAQRRLTSAVEDAAEAQAGIEEARIEGARRVADAQEQVADAQRALADAWRTAGEAQAGIEEARIDGARRVAEAQEQVADAQRAVAKAVEDAAEAQAAIEQARIDGAKQVADAQAQVAEAQLRVQRATEDAAKAQNKLAEAAAAVGATLTASQAALLAQAQVFGGQFASAFGRANDMFNQLGVEVLRFAGGTLPTLGRVAEDVMSSFGASVRGAMATWSETHHVEKMMTFLNGMAPVVGNITTAISDLALGLVGIFAASTPDAIKLSEVIAGIAQRFREWSMSAEGARQITAAIAAAKPVFQALWDMVVQVSGALIKFGMDNAPAIAKAIGWISSAVTAAVNAFAWLTKTLGPVVLIVAALSPVVIGAMMIIGSLASAVIGLVGVFTPLIAIVKLAGAVLIGMSATPLLVVAAIGALVGSLILAYRHWEGFRRIVNTVASFLRDVVVGIFRTFYAGLTGDTRYFARAATAIWKGLQKAISAAVDGIVAAAKAGWAATVATWNSAGRALRSATASLGDFLRKHWNAFWSFLRNLWTSASNAVVTTTRNWSTRLRDITNSLGTFLRNLWTNFWSFLRNLWTNSSSAVVQTTTGWGTRLREIASSLGSFLRNLWSTFWGWLGNLWRERTSAIWQVTDRWATQIGDRIRGLKDGIINAVRAAWDWVRDKTTNLWDWWRDFTNTRATQIGDRVRGLKDGLINAVKGAAEGVRTWAERLGDWLGSAILKGVNKARKWMGSLMTAVGNVLGAFGMDNLASSAKDRAAKLKTPIAMAKGGVVTRRDGGFASSPTVLYGEAGPEAYGRLDVKTPQSVQATRALMQSPNRPPEYGPPSAPRKPEGRPHRHGMARGGILGGEGLGAAHYNWHPSVAEKVRDIEGKYRTKANTYYGHPGGDQWSADFWSPGGRGSPIASSVGDAITGYIDQKYREGLRWIIWAGKINSGGGWQPYNDPADMHYDHVHATWGGKGLMGALGRAGQSLLAKAQALWDKFKPDPPNIGAGMLGDGFRGFGRDLIGKAWNWIKSKIPSGGGDYGGINASSNRELGKKMLEASGTSGSWGALDELWRRESNWNELADNPTSDAYGIPQANPGSKMSSHGSDWRKNPKTQIAWGLDYIAGRYGSTDRALSHHDANNWYRRGGVIPGPKGMPQIIGAHAGERVLPIGLTDSFDRLANSIEIWSSRAHTAGGIPTGGADESATVKELRAIRKENSESARIQTAILDSLPKEIKESVDYNLEHSRSTRRSSVRGHQKEQGTTRLTRGRT